MTVELRTCSKCAVTKPLDRFNYHERPRRRRYCKDCEAPVRNARYLRWKTVQPGVVDLPGEEWRPAYGFEGFYDVSNLGRIRSAKRRGGTWFHRLIATPSFPPGYPRATLYANGPRQSVLVHRIVASTFLRPPDGDEWVNHIDGTKTNNRVLNLEWSTPLTNNQHALATGLRPKQTAVGWTPSAKLTEDDVRQIRQIGKSMTGVALAKKFGVSTGTVSMILSGKIWTHVA